MTPQTLHPPQSTSQRPCRRSACRSARQAHIASSQHVMLLKQSNNPSCQHPIAHGRLIPRNHERRILGGMKHASTPTVTGSHSQAAAMASSQQPTRKIHHRRIDREHHQIGHTHAQQGPPIEPGGWRARSPRHRRRHFWWCRATGLQCSEHNQPAKLTRREGNVIAQALEIYWRGRLRGGETAQTEHKS